MSAATLALVPTIPQGLRLQWEAAQDAHVLLYPEGMVRLNHSAAAILQLCDGRLSVDDIVHELERRFDTGGLAPEVLAFIAHALERRWLEPA